MTDVVVSYHVEHYSSMNYKNFLAYLFARSVLEGQYTYTTLRYDYNQAVKRGIVFC